MSWIDSIFGPLCPQCHENRTHAKLCESCELMVKMVNEEKRKCPIDSVVMEKEVQSGIIIDRCPKCKGVFLDAEELEMIKKMVADDHSNDGLATGFVIGSIIN